MLPIMIVQGFPRWLSSKEFTCNAGARGDVASIPGSVRPPTHSSALAWKIQWAEETGRLQPTGLQRVRQD